MLTTSLMGRNLMLFGHDGPGVRTFFLLPLPARSIVLAKDIGYLITVLAQTAAILVVVAVVGVRFEPAITTTAALGAVAVAMVALVVGNHYSTANPTKPASRGSHGAAAAIWPRWWACSWCFSPARGGGSIWLTRHLAGPLGAGGAGLAASAVLAAGGLALWWLSVDRAGAAFIAHREKLIEVLAKADAT